jgi:hypothetical protein
MNESERSERGHWLLIALVVYFIPFVAIVVDEGILHTFWFSSHFPKGLGDVFRTIYPFHKLLH